MALQPYSGDARRPSAAAPSYFTAAAIQAGYAGYSVASPPPPAAHRDALHRELHDERVREEYLAREIDHNRRLLDQRLRHQPPPIYPSLTEYGAASVPQRVERPPAPIYPSLTEYGAASVPQRVERPPARLPHFLEVGVDGRPVERRLGFRRAPAVLRPKAVIVKRRPPVKRAVVSRAESTLPQKSSGIKRKAATMEAANDPPQQDKKWSCSLCQVFATSEHNLKKHLQGQKHKAAQESRSSQPKVADKLLPAADGLKEVNKQLSTAKESFFCDVCEVKCNSQSMLNSHLNGKRHKEGSLNSQSKVPEKTGDEQGLTVKKQKATHDGSKQVNKLLSTNLAPEEQKQSNPVPTVQKLFCDVCKVKCNSQSMMNSHLNGRRHKEGSLNSQSKVADKTGEQAKKQKAMSQSKVADKVLPVDGSKQVNKQSDPVPKEQKLFCDICKVKCNSQSNLNAHLNGKLHKESLTLLAKEPGNVMSAGTSNHSDKLTSSVAVKETKPGVQQKQVLKSKPKEAIKENAVVEQKQSFDCDDCKLKCKSLIDLKSHLNGKKHKLRLEELNKVQDDKLITSDDNDKPAKAEAQSFNCDDCKLKCKSLTFLKSHLNGKKHKARLEELNNVQDDKLITSEDNDKPAKAEAQSFNCDDCKLKCNSSRALKSHLHGKKHKAQLEELNKVITSEDTKLATAERSGKDDSPVSVEDSGKENKPLNAVETEPTSDKPATTEQSGNDSTCVTVTVEDSGEDDKPTGEQSEQVC